jgi:hypothetical protein
MAKSITMRLHVKYRLYILIYCMKLVSYLNIGLAIKLGEYINNNLDKYIIVKGA